MTTVKQLVNFFKLPASYFVHEHTRIFDIVSKAEYNLLEARSRMNEFKALDMNVLNKFVDNTFDNTFDKRDVETVAKADDINKFKTKYGYNTYKEMRDNNNVIGTLSTDAFNNVYKIALTSKQLTQAYIQDSHFFNFNSQLDSNLVVHIYPAKNVLRCCGCTYQAMVSAYDVWTMFKKHSGSNIPLDEFSRVHAAVAKNSNFKSKMFTPVYTSTGLASTAFVELSTPDYLFMMNIVYNESINDFVYES